MQATHETNKHECPLKWLMNWVQGALLFTEYNQTRIDSIKTMSMETVNTGVLEKKIKNTI